MFGSADRGRQLGPVTFDNTLSRFADVQLRSGELVEINHVVPLAAGCSSVLAALSNEVAQTLTSSCQT